MSRGAQTNAPRDPLRDADRAVGRARVRLTASRAFAAFVNGTLIGALGGLLLILVLYVRDVPGTAPRIWVLALPCAGALVATVAGLRRRPAIEVAALALDRAAGSDEAFLSALAARDASPEMRRLSAEYALHRCAPSDVARVLHIPTPAAAAATVIVTALLAAVVLVPAAHESDPPSRTSEIDRLLPGSHSGGNGASPEANVGGSPSARATEFTKAVRAGDDATARGLAPDVGGDLASVSDDELRDVAAALAGRGIDGAAEALAALLRGDRSGAIEGLRRALRFRDAGAAGAADAAGAAGGELASAPPTGLSEIHADLRIPASWPLRYDRSVRNWLAERDRPEELK